MQTEDRPSDAPPQEGGRILPFPTLPKTDPLARKLRLIAEAHELAAEAARIQARLAEAGAAGSVVLAEKVRDVLAAAGRLVP